jgi:hypothetical protein
MGETVLRVPLKLMVQTGGHFGYSRYDAIKDAEVIRHFLTHKNRIYHFVYGEKSHHRPAHFAGRNGNKILVTIHHPPDHSAWLFRSLDHFRRVDSATVVSRNQVAFWEGIIGKGKVAYVPYAVDAGYFHPLAAANPARPRRCLFLGQSRTRFRCPQALGSSTAVCEE